MSSNQAIPNLYAAGAESGVKKIGETVSNRAVNFLIDGVKDKIKKKKIEIGTVFERYLENASKRYNKVKTLATGVEPRAVIGKDNIYVKVGVDYNGSEIDTSSVNNLLDVSSNIIISGTGGVGKTMLMRYLFLQTVLEGEYVPVLVELRKISEQPPDKLSVKQLIKDCVNSFDVALPDDEFEYSLKLGKYLFLFDGFDEVRTQLSVKTAEAIQEFCAKYPDNACIVTTRPSELIFPLETFTEMNSKPLTKEQAVELASKIWERDEKTEAFYEQLRGSLYDKHKSFAKNPLLLSMMFLTFMRYDDIPDHLAEFYEKAYSSLYNLHDSRNKGHFKRDFKCKSLDEAQFKLLFSCFCFHTYFKEKYEFSEKQILSIIEVCIKKRGLTDISAKDFLADLQDAVCMIVKEGFTLRFAHRSFQTYFAAVYTSAVLSDEQQTRLFSVKMNENVFKDYYEYEFSRRYCDYDFNRRYYNFNYFKLLFQIEPEKFIQNALEEGLREIISCADSSDSPEEYVLKEMFLGSAVLYRDYNAYVADKPCVEFYQRMPDAYESVYNHNALSVFTMICFDWKRATREGRKDPDAINLIRYYYSAVNGLLVEEKQEVGLLFESVDRSDSLTDDERDAFYASLIKTAKIKELIKQIRTILADLDKKRAALENDDFIDSL